MQEAAGMKKMGLVLGGGGAKGSYEIGVWMALRDLGLERYIGGVSGASIGALNMALFAQGDLQRAVTLWLALSTRDVVGLDFKRILLSQNGALSQKKVRGMIHQFLDLDALQRSPLELFACCCRTEGYQAEYFDLKDDELPESVETILLASSAIPVAFPPVRMDGRLYCDGGVTDNEPVRPLYEAGYRRFIVVGLNPDKPPATQDFAGAEFCVVLPRRKELFHSGMETVLSFSPEKNLRRIGYGYQDGMEQLGAFFGRG